MAVMAGTYKEPKLTAKTAGMQQSLFEDMGGLTIGKTPEWLMKTKSK